MSGLDDKIFCIYCSGPGTSNHCHISSKFLCFGNGCCNISGRLSQVIQSSYYRSTRWELV